MSELTKHLEQAKKEIYSHYIYAANEHIDAALAEAERLERENKELRVACKLAKHELIEITTDSYALAAIEQATKESKDG